MTTIGLIGAGNIGQAVARLAVDHGYDVVLSNSRGPETLTDVVAGLGAARAGRHRRGRRDARRPRRGDDPAQGLPGRAGRAAGRQGRHRHEQLLPAARRADRRARRQDDHVGLAAAGAPAGVAGREGVQPHPVRAPHSSTPRRPAPPDRRALAIAGDDDGRQGHRREARSTSSASTSSTSARSRSRWRIEPGTPGYGPRLDADGMREALAAAQR